MDLTNGPIFKKLVLFAIPIALSGVLQLLFNAADLIVIGQLSATPEESLAAVSSNGSIIHLIINVALGLSIGANVVMAQSIGARNHEKASKTLHTSISISLILGFALGIIGFLLTRTILTIMNTDPVIIDKSELYLKIYFLGMPANIVYNFGSALLRAKGDTRRPMIYLTIAGVLNVLTNIVLVLCGWDVAGVAVATIFSQYVSAILLVIALFRESDYCKLFIKKLRVHKRELIDILRVGLPSGVLSSCFSLANVIIQSAINEFCYIIVAGCSTSGQLEGFAYTVINSISSDTVSFVGQNYGARNFKRIKRVITCGFILSFIASMFMTATLLIFGAQLSSLYTSDTQIIEYAVQKLWVIMPLYFTAGFYEILIGALRGMNKNFITMIVSLFCICIFRIIWVNTACKWIHEPYMLYLSYPISWALNFIIDLIVFIVVYRRIVRNAQQTPLDVSTRLKNSAPTPTNEQPAETTYSALEINDENESQA
jgi:putative MATE family efflux protein